jgi:carotenoid cleavage dioxygenase-like enzyme
VTQRGPGFRSLAEECSDYTPAVEGTIPGWLSGTLVRNGPGRFEAGGEQVDHWFDGLAMLRRYAFEDGAVSYSNRFLRTKTYEDAESGRLTGQFGADAQSRWKRLRSVAGSFGPPEPTDNANVHVARVDGEYVAFTEVPRRVSFDPETLATRGEFSFADDLPEQVTVAHLVDDPHRNELVGFSTQFGLTPRYHVYRVPTGSRERDRIASLEARGPAYIHDCSVTDEHVVIVEPPLVLSLLQALSPFSQGPVEMLDWRPDERTRVLVVDRDTGELVAEPTVDPVFVFHHVNAYTDDGTVVLDLIEFPDDRVIHAMSMSELDRQGQGFPDIPEGNLVRYRIEPGTGTVRKSRLYDGGVEFPRVPRACTGRRHRYAYGQATDRTRASGLVKIDCETGIAREWWEQSTYVEEPLPVQRPGGDAEDDGVVLATALDTARERTSILVFDAATLELLARAPLPHAEPFGFHGRFFRN